MYAQISANILGHSITLPVIDKRLQLPDTQKIVLINFSDNIFLQDVIISLVC